MFRTKAVEKIKTYFMFINFFVKIVPFLRQCGEFVYNDRSQTAIRRTGIPCWIPKATYTQSKYVTLIAFSRQQWLRGGASLLLYAYIAYLIAVLLHTVSY